MTNPEKVQSIPENRESFLKRLESLPEEIVQTIDFAYDLTKEAHRTAQRDSGERYFEHPRQVALILIDELKILDPDMIMALLFHDTGEDSPIFGNVTKDYKEWEKAAEFRIKKVANKKVAKYVIALTKPKADNINFFSKEQAHNFYIQKLKESSPETILLKMCDRLHNLRSLSGTTPQKQTKTCIETLNIYFPIFDLIKDKYPQHHSYLINQMQQEINKYDLTPPRQTLPQNI
jgi:(p)ppGpp synthase/HD superfamily hydrolase